MARLRPVDLLAVGGTALLAWSAALQAEMCNGNPNWKPRYNGDTCPIPLHTPSSGASAGKPSAQQTIDAINRNTAAQQKAVKDGFDRLRDVLVDEPRRRTGESVDDRDATGPAPYISDKDDKVLRPDPEEVDDRSAERAERRRQREAADLLNDARSVQDCVGLMSTYRSGPQRDLPAECLSDVERMSVYRSGGSRPAPPPARLDVDAIIDGSSIPSSIVFSDKAVATTERILVGPPPPPAETKSPPTPPSDLDRAPDTPSTTLTPYYDPTPMRPSEATLPSNGARTSSGSSDADAVVTSPPTPSLMEIAFETIFGPPKPAPIRQLGGPDDALAKHQADVDRATSFWNLLNPFKGPIDAQWTINEKMDRTQQYLPPRN